MISVRNNKIYITRDIGAPLYIGFIDPKSSTLFVHDTDNYHLASKSLGIDQEVLKSPSLDYLYISIKWMNKPLRTTRFYFKTHSTIYNLLNGRVQRFMSIRDFDLNKALDYEHNLDKQRSEKQLDVFDIGAIEDVTGNRLLNAFVTNLEHTTQKVIDEEIKNGKKSSKGKQISFS